MKRLVVICFVLAISNSVIAQNINQFNENGKRHGVWRKYFDGTEVLRYEGAFNNGKETGLFKFYKKVRGKAILSATKQFDEASNIAEVKFFTSKGKVISEGKMREKVYIGTWKYYQKNSDQLLTLEHYNDNGQLNGERIVYYDNGQIAEKTTYVNGLLQGEAINYSLKGGVLKHLYYADNELHGNAKFYNPKGDLIVKGQYRKGKKHGIWEYYENGKLSNTKDFTVKGKYKLKKTAP
ncbi:hypothetical protein MHTCC0001_05200 [Flavobacteriaceae bacterium MHTCC 0001]